MAHRYVLFSLSILTTLSFVAAVSVRSPWHLSGLPSHHFDAFSSGTQLARRDNSTNPPQTPPSYFDQLIDHEDPSLGTFKQRYWANSQHYQPGGPVILFPLAAFDSSLPQADIWFDNRTVPGHLAQTFGGAVIVLEHRFFGDSNPYPDLSEKSFRVLTIQQAIDDLEYFANNVHPSMSGGNQLGGPKQAPWILVGTGYAAAVISYTMHSKPGVFYAGYASDATVQAMADYWKFSDIIREFMPANCSADVQAAVAQIDGILASGDDAAKATLKRKFGMEGLQSADDFGYALQNPIFWFQDQSVVTPGSGPFWEFCNALEIKDSQVAGASGWGADHAIDAWGAFTQGQLFWELVCIGNKDLVECFDFHFSTSDEAFSNVTVGQWGRSWGWLQCNELGFSRTGAPEGYPTISSRFVDLGHFEFLCMRYFPETYSTRPPVYILEALETNQKYGGWNSTAERLIYVNNLYDPWRGTTTDPDGLGGNGTELQPHLLVEGWSSADIFMYAAQTSPSVSAAHDTAMGYFSKWLGDWKPTPAH